MIRKTKTKRLAASLTMMGLFATLLTFNVTESASATVIDEAASPTLCAVQLTPDEMAGLYGAGVVEGLIDASCAGAGLFSVFAKLNPFVGAFCVGWAIGRVLDYYL